nr:hypothetical protein [Mycobacterium sp.]
PLCQLPESTPAAAAPAPAAESNAGSAETTAVASNPAAGEPVKNSLGKEMPADAAPLPPPEALTDVMYRLADPAVPGKDKLDLVENTTADEAGTIDRFAAALRDGGFTPLTFAASEIRWSDHQPGDALATINVTTSNPVNPGGFTFPMEFRPHNGGWQLSRETADMLLAFGNARTEAGPTTSPAPPR